MALSKFTLILIIVSFFPSGVPGSFAFPVSFGHGSSMFQAGQVKTWPPETMYERVNGEAELLKRYGAMELAHTVYEGGGGAFLAVDLLDMGAPVNAYGLYRLYAACEGGEFTVSGATVLPGDWTYYARRGRFFLRMEVEGETPASVVKDFLNALSGTLPAPGPLPETLETLLDTTGKACGVHYHPENVNYDLDAGPGYSWEGPGGEVYYLRLEETAEKADFLAAKLKSRGVVCVSIRGSMVAWPKTSGKETLPYLDGILEYLEE
jgi:hypothetical protein